LLPEAFAIWITGLPGSGKSTIAKSLHDRLTDLGIDSAVIEPDELRRELAPQSGDSEGERDRFHGQMMFLGTMMAKHGIPVIFDGTADQRLWREEARKSIPNFIEVYVDAPLQLCMSRHPKGSVQAAYEPPEHPEVVVDWADSASRAANRIVSVLIERDYLMPPPSGAAIPQEHSARTVLV
jgi:adenylylsulfate kinase